jgi:Tol biopolymer transport system component
MEYQILSIYAVRSLLISAFSVAYLTGMGQFYQGTNMEFGKNRIQYKEFDWFLYPSDHFEVHFYVGGESMAEYTLKSAEKQLVPVEKFYDFTMDDKIQIITYLTQNDWRQSNVGLGNEDQFNIGGVAKIMGTKMFVFYDDSRETLDRQIRENISRVMYMQLIYGGDWIDVIKNSTLLSVPTWYEEGVIKYAANGHNPEASLYMKDMVRSNSFKSLNFLEGNDAQLAGEAFWSYIGEVYGDNVIPNILYMAQASKNIESGFLYVLGVSIDSVTKDFAKFYREKTLSPKLETIPGDRPMPKTGDKIAWKEWKTTTKDLGDIHLPFKSKFHYSQFRLSPNQEHWAFVTHEYGQYRIWIYDVATQKSRCILKREHRLDRIADESYPVLAWHPTSQLLTYFYEDESQVFIGNYNLTDKEKIEKNLKLIQKVQDPQYSPDGKKIVFSGVRNGQTDLFIYQSIGNNFTQLTNDPFDDVQPQFIDQATRVIFSSNRTDDTLRKDVPNEVYPHFKDIFIITLDNGGKVMERLTDTPGINESYPAPYAFKKYAYLSDESGVSNQYVAHVDSVISAIDTAIHYRYFTVSEQMSTYSRSPIDFQAHSDQRFTQVFYRMNRPFVTHNTAKSPPPRPTETPSPSAIKLPVGKPFLYTNDSIQPGPVDTKNYVFDDEVKDYAYEKETVKVTEFKSDGTPVQAPAPQAFVMPRSRNYRLNFTADRLTTQATNVFFTPTYQNFTSPTSITPGLSGMTQIHLTDLFEDYRIVGGFRFGLDLSNQEYGVSLEKLADRWDRKLQFIRQVETFSSSIGFESYKLQMNTISYSIKYPFTEVSAIRFRGDVRHDKLVQQSSDIYSLEEPNQYEINLMIKAEYIYDNTFNKGLNLFTGTRFKCWAERFQQPNLEAQRTDINTLGFDFRHYHKIHRSFIAAFRAAGATSFGQYKIINYLGGVDNWILQRVDNATPIDYENGGYRFQSFVGPVRGFYVNARNGNSAVVSNVELRMPIIKYLMQKPIRNDFLQNLQLISFFDAGAAWTGKNPYDDTNLFNQTTIDQQPVAVTVYNNREPIVYGYGFGIRSRLLGYFVRADWAWGVDDGQVLDRVFYLSLNMDF